MERCACKNSLIAKCLAAVIKNGAMQRDVWHVRRELLRRAVWLTILYGASQLFGFREWVTALLQGAAASPMERIGCMTYLFFYGSFVFIVPVLVIATVLLTVWESIGRLTSGKPNQRTEQE